MLKVYVHVGGANAGQGSNTDHPTGFAHRATTGLLAGYPFETLQGCFFCAGYQRFFFYSKNEIKVSLNRVIVNSEIAYFDKANW